MPSIREKSPAKGGRVSPQPVQAAVNGVSDSQTAANELTTAVDDLLEQMRGRFAAVSEEMLAKMDDMARRLDNLEAALRTREEADTASASASAAAAAGGSGSAGGESRRVTG